MSFVDDHVDPFVLAEEWAVLDDILVRREAHLERIVPHLVLDALPGQRWTLVVDNLDCRCPLGKLQLPIRHGRQRNDDKEWTRLLFDVDEVGEERDCLDSLAQTLSSIKEPDGNGLTTVLCRPESEPKTQLTISSARMPFSLLL